MLLGFFSVHSDGGSGSRRATRRLDGGEDRQEAQSDVLLAAIRVWLHHNYCSAECVDALCWQSAHRPRQWRHVTGRPGKNHDRAFFPLLPAFFFDIDTVIFCPVATRLTMNM